MKEKLFKTMRMFLALALVVTLIIPTVSIPSEAASKLSTPALVSVSNTSSGVTVKWKKVSNASGYYVYRKTGSGKWSKIATVKKNSTVSYADKKAVAGKTYTYTVKAYKGKTASSYNKKGLTIKRLTQPSVSVKNTSSGVKVIWNKVTGASKYRVYYKADGKWKKLADTTSTSYTDKSVKSGASRTYTVKAISGSYGSSYVSGKTITYLSQPSPSVSNTSTGVKISWDKATGAKTYRVYYKNDSGKWIKLADTTSTSYTDKTVKSGESRTYTVKAISGSYSSSYMGGKTIKYLSQPTPSATNTDSGVKITWSKVTGASKYRVYRKTAGTSWQKLADTTSTSYTDSTAVSGTEYYYTVKALSGSYSSSYTSSLRITYTAVHVHSYTSSVTKAATCDTNGVKTYTCSCGDSYTEVIKATGHNWEEQTEKQWVVDGQVWVVDKEAYDEEVLTGYDVYYECNGCGVRFEDSDEASEHLFVCPSQSGNGYSAHKTPIYETVHHDEEGHYEDTGHYENVITGYKCSKCGATK